jgi:SAM-dependent methyltransferase
MPAPRLPRAFSSLEVLDAEFPLTAATIAELGVRGFQCGCGDAIRRYWLNTDFIVVHDAHGNESRPGQLLRLDADRFYFQHDARDPFPVAGGSFDRCYSEHFIEHLELDQGIAWLAEIRRLLRPGGFLRLSTPDLRKYVAGYADPGGAFFAEHRPRIAPILPAHRRRFPDLPELADPAGLERPCFMVNQIFKMWGHKWIYDLDELRYAAARAGFTAGDVEERSHRDGRDAEVAALDTPFRSDESVYVEISKT